MSTEREAIVESQAKIAREAQDATSPLFYMQPLIGPPEAYENIVDGPESVGRVFPWKDGRWARGVEIGGNGMTVKFTMGEDPDNCAAPEDLVAFMFFFFQHLGLSNKHLTPEFEDIVKKLDEIQLKLMAAAVRTRMRKHAIYAKQEFQRKQREKGKEPVDE